MTERRCPDCDELACFCPNGVKEPSIQWNGMFDDSAIAIEAQRAVTTKIGTVRSTKARAESIAQTVPSPSSRERK